MDKINFQIRCTKCDKILTSKSGRKIRIAIWDSRLRSLVKPDPPLFSKEGPRFAWCKICYSDFNLGPL